MTTINGFDLSRGSPLRKMLFDNVDVNATFHKEGDGSFTLHLAVTLAGTPIANFAMPVSMVEIADGTIFDLGKTHETDHGTHR